MLEEEEVVYEGKNRSEEYSILKLSFKKALYHLHKTFHQTKSSYFETDQLYWFLHFFELESNGREFT